LFFDQEMARVLQSWLVTRKHLRASGQGAFFPSKWSTRPHLNHGTITWIVSGCAERVRRPWCWLVLDWQLTGISAPPYDSSGPDNLSILRRDPPGRNAHALICDPACLNRLLQCLGPWHCKTIQNG
jgi:hypothetical protein